MPRHAHCNNGRAPRLRPGSAGARHSRPQPDASSLPACPPEVAAAYPGTASPTLHAGHPSVFLHQCLVARLPTTVTGIERQSRRRAHPIAERPQVPQGHRRIGRRPLRAPHTPHHTLPAAEHRRDPHRSTPPRACPDLPRRLSRRAGRDSAEATSQRRYPARSRHRRGSACTSDPPRRHTSRSGAAVFAPAGHRYARQSHVLAAHASKALTGPPTATPPAHRGQRRVKQGRLAHSRLSGDSIHQDVPPQGSESTPPCPYAPRVQDPMARRSPFDS